MYDVVQLKLQGLVSCQRVGKLSENYQQKSGKLRFLDKYRRKSYAV